MISEDEIDALMRNPTHEGAMKFWDWGRLGSPLPDAPLAGLHKARLHWPKATVAMRLESRQWLLEHGFMAVL